MTPNITTKQFTSGKVYTYNEGLSCCFRQWRASSHCNLLHGYALQFEFEFGAVDLDARNWVVDFGGLKKLRAWLHDMFDHTTLVAADDPELDTFKRLNAAGIIDLRILEKGVGCERIAELAFEEASRIVSEARGAWVVVVKVSEHAGNSASFYG